MSMERDIQLKLLDRNLTVEELENAIENGLDFDRAIYSGMTLLHWACAHGLSEHAKLLIRSGADTNLASHTGDSPIVLAASAGSVECIRLLIGAGANINARDKYELHAVAWAFHAACQECVMEFFRHGVDIRREPVDEKNPNASVFEAMLNDPEPWDDVITLIRTLEEKEMLSRHKTQRQKTMEELGL